MTEQELYEALVRLCQDYGYCSQETYAKLHEAIGTIILDPAVPPI